MAIRTVEVHTIKVYKQCDRCHVDLIFTGMAQLTDPMQYEHECPICKNIVALGKVYPAIEYIELSKRD